MNGLTTAGHMVLGCARRCRPATPGGSAAVAVERRSLARCAWWSARRQERYTHATTVYIFMSSSRHASMRPEIDDDVVEAVDQLVDKYTRVPVDHLTLNQRLEVLVGITGELEERVEADTTSRTSRSGRSFTR